VIHDLEPFASPLLLVSKAKEDIEKIKAECADFVKLSRHTLIENFDSKTKEQVIKIRLDGPIPGALRVSVSRVVNDLRHALDQALCDGALFLGATRINRTYFPFGADKSDFNDKVKQHCKDVHPALVDFIKGFNSYFGGDDLLWSLTRLAAKKHQGIIALGIETKGFQLISDRTLDIKSPFKLGINKWNDRKNELEFARIGPGGHMNMKFTIPFEVVMGSADIVGGKPTQGVLEDYARIVESIVLGIKAESFRIKGV